MPPRLLFPEAKDAAGNRNMRVNLITVPSCDAHNSHKSRDDEYLLWVLSSNALANAVGIRQGMTKLARSYVRRPKLGDSILSTSRPVKIADSHSDTEFDVDELDLDGPRFEASLVLIARGLYFHHFGKRWDGDVDVHADFIGVIDDGNQAAADAARIRFYDLAEQLFAAEPRHGENPNVFWHKVHQPAEAFECLMRLAFYGGCTVTVLFGKPRGTLATT